MLRLFQTNQIRQVQELEGLWDFYTCPDGAAPGKHYRLFVPGSWEMNQELCNYRGKGVYEKELFLERETNLRLDFYGVSHTADVYLDGSLVAHHYNAYTKFTTVVPHLAAGRHQLKVEVSNAFGEESALHFPNDYYSYGGITRPVAMSYLPDLFVEQIHFTPRQEAGKWKARVQVKLQNLRDSRQRGSMALEVANKTLAVSVLLEPGENMVEKEMEFENVAAWDASSPSLYQCRAILMQEGVEIDDLIERVAFREVKTAGQDLLVNGKKVLLRGFNRHEDHPLYGCAIPVPQMVQDLELIRGAGANTVRTCHYPNDPRFLDLCDEMGFYVWEESHARGVNEERMRNPNFEIQSRDCIDEMIRDDYNHPSIILWGVINEGASDTAFGREQYKLQFEQIKRLDPSRPRTFASCRHFKDLCMDLVDVVSFNIYPLWYFEEDPTAFLDRLRIWIKSVEGVEKPFIISEIGAGAIYGFRTPLKSKWSEERQAEILDTLLSTYLHREDVTGMILWQFCDCRVHEELFSGRPKTENNKGVVDIYRRPKLAYEVVRRHFTEE